MILEENRGRRTKRMMLLVILIILAILCMGYGILVMGIGSGTKFFLIWFVIAGIFIAIGLCTYFGLWDKIPSLIRKCIIVLFGLGLLSFVVIEGCVVSNLHCEEQEDLDYLIVLGAQVKADGPSIVLKYRLDRAIEYLEANPNTICIVSGGQGVNEPMSEAEGMAQYLVKYGIPKKRLILESKSKTTEQNLKYSKDYIQENASVGILTNNFHMFRALQIAKSQGVDATCGIVADSTPKFLPNNMLREYFAEVKYLVLKTYPSNPKLLE